MSRLSTALLLAGMLAAVVAAATFAITQIDSNQTPWSSRYPGAVLTVAGEIGGPFTLTDHAGERVASSSFGDQYRLIYFGYTYCPDVCPTELGKVAVALDELGPAADRILPLFISVDPKRDTPEVLRDYVPHFDPRMVGLTGTAEEIARVAKAYKVYAKAQDAGAGNDYLVDHTSVIYLTDANDRLVTAFSGRATPEAIAGVIRDILGGG